FTSKIAFFHILLRIVPCSTGIGHEDSKYKTTTQSANQQSQYTGNTKYQSGKDWSNDGNQRRHYHFPLCSFCRNSNATFVVRFGFPGQDTFHFTELAAYFIYHMSGSTSDCIHSQTTEQE